MSLIISTEGISNFDNPVSVTPIKYPLISFELFKKKYEDDDLLFFCSLFPELRNILIKSITVLETAVKNKDDNEWNSCVMALKSIAETLFFTKLKKITIKNKPNVSDYNKLTTTIKNTLILATAYSVNVKQNYGFWRRLKNWCYGSAKVF